MSTTYEWRKTFWATKRAQAEELNSRMCSCGNIAACCIRCKATGRASL